MRGGRSKKTSLIVLLLTGATMVSGVVLAFIGQSTPQWAPPPLPKAWEAPAVRLSPRQPASARAASQQQPAASRRRGQSDQRPGRTASQVRHPPALGHAATSRRPRVAATPRPAPSVIASPTPSPARTDDPARTASPSTPTLRLAAAPAARSVPVSITIPAIGVQAAVIQLGLQAGGAMAVPPLTRPSLTGWFDRGPTPGQPGTAVIVGHVDAAGVGPAVFYRLGDLLPGQRIYVTLANRRTAIFQVWAAALYPKAGFPLGAVYGYTALPSLRLITCGGVFNPQTGHYLSNIVVYASYLGHT